MRRRIEKDVTIRRCLQAIFFMYVTRELVYGLIAERIVATNLLNKTR